MAGTRERSAEQNPGESPTDRLSIHKVRATTVSNPLEYRKHFSSSVRRRASINYGEFRGEFSDSDFPEELLGDSTGNLYCGLKLTRPACETYAATYLDLLKQKRRRRIGNPKDDVITPPMI